MRQILDRRVVVTGLGLVTPLGTGVEKNWEALMAGRSGIATITSFDVSDFPVKIAGEVKDFNPEDWIDKRDVKKMDLFIQYAVGAAEQAMRQSGFQVTEENADNVGVLVGVGIGGLRTIEEYHKEFLKTGLKRITPFFIPKLISNLRSGPDLDPLRRARSQLCDYQRMLLGQSRDRRSLSHGEDGLPRRRDRRRRGSGANVAWPRRLRRDARALDPQRRARKSQPPLR